MKLLRGCSLWLLALSCAFPALGEDHWKTDKATGCRIEAPQTWEKYTVQWIGTCVAGVADGSGVLKGFGKRKVQELYYGRASQGVLEIGVIETDKGYVAGRFTDGKAVQDGDRQTYILAFREAVAGANQASEYYREKGNPASSKYYSEKAKTLDQQMD
jgi:hypothetical protein